MFEDVIKASVTPHITYMAIAPVLVLMLQLFLLFSLQPFNYVDRKVF
jgi:hypothetical protein